MKTFVFLCDPMVYVYGISIDSQIVYVGRSANVLDRALNHVNAACRSGNGNNLILYRFLNLKIRTKRTFRIRILDCHKNRMMAGALESFYIHKYKDFHLTAKKKIKGFRAKHIPVSISTHSFLKDVVSSEISLDLLNIKHRNRKIKEGNAVTLAHNCRHKKRESFFDGHCMECYLTKNGNDYYTKLVSLVIKNNKYGC